MQAGHHWRILAGAVVLLACSAVAVADEERALDVRVGPGVSMAPGAVRITALVEPHGENRALVIEVDSGLHYSSSQVPLPGEKAPRAHSVWFKGLPAGSYEVVVRVMDETEPVQSERRQFQVVAPRAAEPGMTTP